jgi:hypothetical protein
LKNLQAKGSLLQSFVVLAAIGFYSMAQAQVENFNVQLRINGTQTGVDITTTGNCSKDNHNGCIEVDKGKQARINFTLIGDKNCNKSDDAKWVMGDVYLGGKGSAGKPSRWGDLRYQVKQDFNVASTTSGRLKNEPDSNKNSLIIMDKNLHAYDIWYKVTTYCIDRDGNSIGKLESDPRIKNGGAN